MGDKSKSSKINACTIYLFESKQQSSTSRVCPPRFSAQNTQRELVQVVLMRNWRKGFLLVASSWRLTSWPRWVAQWACRIWRGVADGGWVLRGCQQRTHANAWDFEDQIWKAEDWPSAGGNFHSKTVNWVCWNKSKIWNYAGRTGNVWDESFKFPTSSVVNTVNTFNTKCWESLRYWSFCVSVFGSRQLSVLSKYGMLALHNRILFLNSHSP